MTTRITVRVEVLQLCRGSDKLWIQRYALEIERRLRWRLKPTNDSWRVDETYVRVKGNRAVDSDGATIDFFLYLREETLQPAIASIVNHHYRHPVVTSAAISITATPTWHSCRGALC